MKANRRIAGKICPICQDEIKLGEAIVICEYCKLPFHSACWEANGGCGTYGCAGEATARPRQSFADFSVSRDQLPGGREAGRPDAGGRHPIPTTSPKAGAFGIASLVFGLLGVVSLGVAARLLALVFGALAIVFGSFAFREMSRDRTARGRGLAAAGLVFGILDVVGGIVWMAVS
jgi:hypothetical protein